MWSNVGEKTLEGPAFVKGAEEKVALIRKRLLEAQSRQKSYANNRRRELRFEEGDFVYLKVSPMHGVKRFQVKGASSTISRPLSYHWQSRTRSLPP
jgi:hypothetical protein